MIERIQQRIRYFPYWLLHPIEYHHSEQLRRACNLIAEMLLEHHDLVGVEVALPNEQEGYGLYARIEQWPDEEILSSDLH